MASSPCCSCPELAPGGRQAWSEPIDPPGDSRSFLGLWANRAGSMGRRVKIISLSALVAMGAVFWAQGSRFEQLLLDRLESEAKEGAGVGFIADHVSLAFSGITPGLAFQKVRIRQIDDDAGQIEAERLTVFYFPGAVHRRAVANIAGLRIDGAAGALLAPTHAGSDFGAGRRARLSRGGAYTPRTRAV